MNRPLLEVRNLQTHFLTSMGAIRAVDDVSFALQRGEVLGLVGESGSGKTITGYSILGVVDEPGQIVGGEIVLRDAEDREVVLNHLGEKQLRRLRGNRIAMIMQDPMMSLNPSLRIGTQLVETVLAHRQVSRSEAERRAVDVMRRVGIPDPEQRIQAFPHEFSGGMRQRIAIAIALINEPDLIIADEPTTALDVTTQVQILVEVQKLARDTGTAWIWITHDLAVVAGLAQHVAVMYAGKVVEFGATEDLLDHPRHPYTRGLIASIPGEGELASGRRLHQIPGNTPSLLNLPEGCAFRTRCDRAGAQCDIQPMLETSPAGNRALRCWHPLEGQSP
ncbi:ABC transporter ATP-binding protein [Devosia ginsengisoli]|uniref:ABC transporter ATP-binding protein n=1 Tax=Devosia ginsengisoli TaxID=400770 RepID=A0A5B8LY36_9HYPH|nr:ABC transporter ATP-binding protein [Devosia ginsengisoli]QDZ12721.1 ABC transporter ATP-binding protein [Devosia ginsengisoli]